MHISWKVIRLTEQRINYSGCHIFDKEDVAAFFTFIAYSSGELKNTYSLKGIYDYGVEHNIIELFLGVNGLWRKENC